MPDDSISRFHLRHHAAGLVVECLATVAVSLCLAPAVVAQEDPADPPSILLIVTDDQRWDTLWAMPEVQRSLVEPGWLRSLGSP
jgi:hypothetical protein